MNNTQLYENRQFGERSGLMALRQHVRWCAWQTEIRRGRDGAEKPVKMPYGRNQMAFKANEPDTWMTWDGARAVLRVLPKMHGSSGIGIVLGELWGEASEYALVGVDLDSCLDEAGGLGEWAAGVLTALGPAYVEVSPSGTGVKAFALARVGDIAGIREALEIPRWWRDWKAPRGAGNEPGVHAAGIEFIVGHRFFTVTGEGDGALGLIGVGEARAVGEVAARWFGDGRGGRAARGAGGDVEVTDEMIRSVVVVDPASDALTLEESGLLGLLPRLGALWSETFVFGDDRSNSTVAFNIARELHRGGIDQARGIGLMLKHPVVREWYFDKGEWDGRRQLARAWFRAGRSGGAGGGGADGALGRAEMPRAAGGDGAGGGGAHVVVGGVAIGERGDVRDLGSVGGADAPWMDPALGDSDAAAAPPAGVDEIPSAVFFPYSQEVLACQMVDGYGHDLRWVNKWGKWMLYQGWKWIEDNRLVARLVARRVCRLAARDAVPALHKMLLEEKMSAAVERLAKSDPRIAVETDIWDADAWMLNTPGGVVDLRSGQAVDGGRLRYMTMSTGVAPDFEGTAPLWSKFLKQVTGGDYEQEAYLRRVAGYLLTGSVREHAMFFLYGTGGNGKSTFMNAISGIMGLEGYAQTADMDMFVLERGQRHKTELARLRSARLVSVSETSRGKTLDEQRINKMTGGDPIDANFMRQDMFTYIPQFKIVICGNHKPNLDGVNEAIARRVNIIPFVVKIAEKDENLPDKLRDEWGAILAWAIRGCVEWQAAGGLHPPRSVVEATNKYLEDSDLRSAWFNEAIKTGSGFATDGEVFANWNQWALRSGEKPGTRKELSVWLATRGCILEKSTTGFQIWKDISIRSQTIGNIGEVIPFNRDPAR